MPKDLDPPFNFDLDRIKASIESGTITLPRGLGHARRQYLRDNNQRLDQAPVERYSAAECVRGLVL